MQVIKRNGKVERFNSDKIYQRVNKMMWDLNKDFVSPFSIVQKVFNGIVDNMETKYIDELIGETAASMVTYHSDYAKLAGRVLISNLHKETSASFYLTFKRLYDTGQIREEVFTFVKEHRKTIENTIDYTRDFKFDFFGIRTLQKSYLLKDLIGERFRMKEGKILERPQHLFMRVALEIWLGDIDKVIETYNDLSTFQYIHATPTLFNSSKPYNQLASCFLIDHVEDSIEGINETTGDIRLISKFAGGIGLNLSNVRAAGSYIKGTGGYSDGLVPYCIDLNAIARHINQGGGKRKGAFACFVKNTQVYTNNGVKNIQDVQIGDLVITHKNRLKPVVQTHKNKLGDRKIYKLEVQRSKPVYVTGNHRFWSFYTKKYKHNKLQLGWNSIKDLKYLLDNPKTTRQSCYIATPTQTGITQTAQIIDVCDYNDNIKIIGDKVIPITGGQHINRFWCVNETFANLIGIWLGDGHHKKTNGKLYGISFTVHNKNTELIEFIIETCKLIFDCNISTHSSNNIVSIDINSRIVAKVFNELVGSGFNDKHLNSIMFKWGKTLVNNLIAGLITTDGHITKDKYNAVLSMSNNKLMTDIYHLCRANGIITSFNKGKLRESKTEIPYIMSIPLSLEIINNVYKYYEDNRIDECKAKLLNTSEDNFLKILSITECDRKDEFVYTLGVEEDHSYMVEGLLAENCYLEPWHSDIQDFLQLKLNHGKEERRARDLFYGLWIPDLFMKRVEDDLMWSLFCPNEAPNLNSVYGEEFEQLYISYEQDGRARKQIKARDLWIQILNTQTETGTPYILYKDAINHKSNFKNHKIIRNSNLCCEIVEPSDSEETAVCNLARLSLPQYIVNGQFDFARLRLMTKRITYNLNNVIDTTKHPTKRARNADLNQRAIGIGVQGLADVFAILKLSWESEEAKQLNKDIFENIYYAALQASNELAISTGLTYTYYENSPISQGIFQFDMWGVTPSSNLDWEGLRNSIKKHGVRNSLLVAPAPTASTAQIHSVNECFEPFTSNLYTRRVLSGEFIVLNKYLIKDLIELGCWDNDMREQLMLNRGSVQYLKYLKNGEYIDIPKDIKDRYKTSYELSQKIIMNMAADRGAFIDQTQSMNLFVSDPTLAKLHSIHFYGWKLGLKTGMYYLRSKPATNPIQFTINTDSKINKTQDKDSIEKLYGQVCTIDDPDCLSCAG